MKNKLIYLAGLFFMILILNSCNSFLNDKPQTSLTTGNAYNSTSDVENALTGCYQEFYGDYYQFDNIMLSDNRSDNAYPGGSGEETFVDEDLFQVPTTNSHNYYQWWGQLYQGISRTNILLEKLPQVKDPKLDENNRRAQVTGEASFLRAFHYYQLVKLYGGVPLELLSNTADPAVTRKPRSTEKAVYDQIEKDLQVAVANLPDNYGSDPSVNKVRATKGAANALLAKIWAQRSDRDYAKVLQYCSLVTDGNPEYALWPDYNQIFDGAHYLNSESILEIPFIEGSSVANWGVEMFLAPEDGWQKYCVPSKDLVAAYDNEGDIIRKNTNIIFYDNLAWPDENWNPCGDAGTKVPFNYKQEHAAGWASGDHLYLLRLADIILLKAEAQNELGHPELAAPLVNQIRSRVSLPAISSSLSKEAMRKAILNERRLELAFEAQRWDDLVRTGVAVSVMNDLNEYKYTCTNGTVSAPVKVNYSKCDQHHLLMPIPQSEIDANPNLIQNPGY
ncbi:MAG: RagB/SusD family nutrient uptake outer membrane protein [Mariniphaga sp.]